MIEKTKVTLRLPTRTVLFYRRVAKMAGTDLDAVIAMVCASYVVRMKSQSYKRIK